MKHCVPVLLSLALAAAWEAPARAEEVLLYATKNPDQVRGIRANGNRDRFLYQGSPSDFFAKSELGRHIARNPVRGPEQYRSLRVEVRKVAGQSSWRIVWGFGDRSETLVPWGPRPLSMAQQASHRGRYFFYRRCVTANAASPEFGKVFDLWVGETASAQRKRVARSATWAAWATLPGEGKVAIEPLAAEVWLERKEERPEAPPRTAAWSETNQAAAGSANAKDALAAMALVDRDDYQRGLEAIKTRLAETRLVYNFTVYARPWRAQENWSCVAASRDRARDLSSRLSERWTVISIERWRLTGASRPGWHTSNVAIFTASDGQTIHVAADNYTGAVECYVLGTSEASWPQAWKRSGSNADYRRGQPVASSTTDTEITKQAEKELSLLQAQEQRRQRAEFSPAFALAEGVTFLPFRVSVRSLDGAPHPGEVVTVRTSSASCWLSDTRKLGAAEGSPQRQTELELSVGSEGVTKVVYLVVKDPARHGETTVSVRAQGSKSSADKSWDVRGFAEMFERLRVRVEELLPGAKQAPASRLGAASGNSLSGALSAVGGKSGLYGVRRLGSESEAGGDGARREAVIAEGLKPLAARKYREAIPALRSALRSVESKRLRVGLAEAYLGEARRLSGLAKRASDAQVAGRLRELARSLRVDSAPNLSRAPQEALERAAELEAEGQQRASRDLYRAALIGSAGENDPAREGLARIYARVSKELGAVKSQGAHYRQLALGHLRKLLTSSDPQVAARARRSLTELEREGGQE